MSSVKILLIENINNVLVNEDLSNMLSKNARIYFEEHVHPVKSVTQILTILKTKLNS